MVLREILHNGEQQLRKQKGEEQITEDILESLECLITFLLQDWVQTIFNR